VFELIPLGFAGFSCFFHFLFANRLLSTQKREKSDFLSEMILDGTTYGDLQWN